MMATTDMRANKRNWEHQKKMTDMRSIQISVFSTAEPRPATGPWHQLYRPDRSSPGICHFSFL